MKTSFKFAVCLVVLAFLSIGTGYAFDRTVLFENHTNTG